MLNSHLVTLSLKNVFRNRRRTFITLAVIILGLTAYLLAVGYYRYVDWGLRESTIYSETGHFQIMTENYAAKDEETVLQYGLSDYQELCKSILSEREVLAVSVRTDCFGLVSNGEKTAAVVVNAVDPEGEQAMRTGFSVGMPSYLEKLKQEEGAAIGSKLAQSLSLKEGDVVTLMATTSQGAVNAVDIKIVDVYSTGVAELDKRAMTISMPLAQRLLVSDKVSRIVITLYSTEDLEQVKQTVAARIKNGYVIKDYHQLAQYYTSVATFFKSIVGFISFVLSIIVFFSISNTILMSVFERTREIGVLRAIGTFKREISWMFIFEGVWLCVFGITAAFAVETLLTWAINNSSIMLPPPPGRNEGYQLMIRNEVGSFVDAAAMTWVIVFAATLYPVYKSVKSNVVDALRHV